MENFLQANGIRHTQSALGYAAYITPEQFAALWQVPGVVIVESRRAAIGCYIRRVRWGLFVRWQVEEAKAA